MMSLSRFSACSRLSEREKGWREEDGGGGAGGKRH